MGVLDKFLGIIGRMAPSPATQVNEQLRRRDLLNPPTPRNAAFAPNNNTQALNANISDPTRRDPKAGLTPEEIGDVPPTPAVPPPAPRPAADTPAIQTTTPSVPKGPIETTTPAVTGTTTEPAPITPVNLVPPVPPPAKPAVDVNAQAPGQYSIAQSQQMASNILQTGLPGDVGAPAPTEEERKAKEAAVARTAATPLGSAALPVAYNEQLQPVESIGSFGEMMSAVPPPPVTADATGIQTQPIQTRDASMLGKGLKEFTTDTGEKVALGTGGRLVNAQNQEVGKLGDAGRFVYLGKEVTKVGNDLVDMQGNKVGDFGQAYNADRDFRFAFDLNRIQKDRADAAQRGDRQAMDALNVEEARARRQWVADRPKDTTRSWGDVLKGIGLGALRGFATGGLGGAVGGAIVGGAGTAINPEVRQRLQDEMFRMPEAEGRVKAAEAQQQAGQTLEAGRLGVLGAEQNLQQNVIQTRAQALQNEGVYKRWVKGEKVTAQEITEMERRLGFYTGIKPGFSGGATVQVNGQYFRVSADGVMEPVRDAKGNFVYDLVNTVVAYRDPRTGRVSYLTSREDAARMGNEALAVFNANERYRRAAETQARIDARAARPRSTYTLKDVRSIEAELDKAQDELDLLGTKADLDQRIAVKQKEIADLSATRADQILNRDTLKDLREQLAKLQEEARTFQTRYNNITRRLNRYKQQLEEAQGTAATTAQQ